MNVHRFCRLLIGMQRSGIDLIKRYIKSQTNPIPDSDEVKLCKRQIADDFRKQLRENQRVFTRVLTIIFLIYNIEKFQEYENLAHRF